MTGASAPGAPGGGVFRHGVRQTREDGMRFSVDGWDPSYGASLATEAELAESTARVEVDVELPADRWRPVDPVPGDPLPEALLFVDGVRRVEARLWIDGPAPDSAPAGSALAGRTGPGGIPAAGPQGGSWGAEPTAALCASYAAGVVCCCAAGAHLVVTELRHGLFSVAPHASDIVTWAGAYAAHRSTSRRAGVPVMKTLSDALQDELGKVEVIAAASARAAVPTHATDTAHAADSDSDLLIVDGQLRGREHLPRALGYIKSHDATYLPPGLNPLVGALAPGQRTPAFLIGTKWERYSWYLRLPGPAGSPWAGVVRVECAANLSAGEVTRLAGLSQRCLGRFASSPYKDSRAPQNLYPIAGLERELRRRLGDPRLLYRALREAARPAP